MRIEITRVTDWQRVVDAARFTVRKDGLGKEPSDKFKKAIVFAEHSPIRLLEYDIKVYDIPKYVSVHFVRHHEGVEKFVCTSRPDRNGFKTTRHEQRDDDPVNMQFSINAQAIINISKVRLCNHAEKETRNLWGAVVQKLKDIDPIVAAACHPSCIYRNVCPEQNGCGFDRSFAYIQERGDYLKAFGKEY